MVFYRKYRPQSFADLVGQEQIAKTLLAQLTSGKISHAYIFYGPRGTGKTSTARIFAKAVNCEQYRLKGKGSRQGRGSQTATRAQSLTFGEPCNKCEACLAVTNGSALDLIEIDAASNRGIDEIRDLREKVKLAPAAFPFKVYIIDEAHMLTNEAFNALLKTLEEPPAHAVFILATTEYVKIPATIFSRLEKFNFKRANRSDIAKAVLAVAARERIKISEEGAKMISEVADGSFRDAISLLDQLSGQIGEIGEKDVAAIAKVSGSNRLFKFLFNVRGGNLRDAVLMVESLQEEGVDISLFIKQAVLYLEKVLYIKIGVEGKDEESEDLAELAQKFEFGRLQTLMRLLLVAEGEIKIYPLPHIPLVLAICKFMGERAEVAQEIGESKESKVKEDLFLTSQKASVTKVKGKSEGSGKTEITEGTRKAGNDEAQEGVREKEMVVNAKVDDKKPKSNKSVKSISEVEKNWGEFLNRVRPVNAHVVALLRATKPFGFDGDNLVLEVFYRFHKEKLEEPRIIEMLDTKMEETIGKRVKLRFVLAERESRPTLTVGKSDVIDAGADELEKIAQEIFSK